MKIVPMQECREQWNAFVDAHPRGWWYHRADWLEFEALQPEYTQHSFAVTDGVTLLTICPLLISQSGTAILPDGPLPRPLERVGMDFEMARTVAIQVAEHIRSLGTVHEWVRRGEALLPDPCCPNTEGWPTRVLDLTQTEDILHADIRKSYQSLINRGIERLEFCEGPMMVDEMQMLRQEAGRPYSRVAHEMMRRWVEQGYALCVAAKDKATEKFVGVNYFLAYKGCAYYMSGVHAEDNVAHALQWRSIQHLRRVLHVKRYEIGWQGHAANGKEKNIEHFKAGFGGEDKPLPVWRITL